MTSIAFAPLNGLAPQASAVPAKQADSALTNLSGFSLSESTQNESPRIAVQNAGNQSLSLNTPPQKPLMQKIGDSLILSGAAAVGSAFSPTAAVKTWKLNSLLGQGPTVDSAVKAFLPNKSLPHLKASFINCVSLFVPHILAKEGLKRTEHIHKLGPKQQDAAAVASSAAFCVALYLGPSISANNILLSGAKVSIPDLIQSKGFNNFAVSTASLFGREALDLASFTWPKNEVVLGIATVGGALLDKIHSSTSLQESKPASLPAIGGFLLFRALESRSLLMATQAIRETVEQPIHSLVQQASSLVEGASKP